MTRSRSTVDPQADAVVRGVHTNPHEYLGRHGSTVRVWRPEAESVAVRAAGSAAAVPMARVHPAGVFSVDLAGEPESYSYEVAYPGGETYTVDDAYAFWPTLGEVDLHLFGEGRHEQLWDVLGAHPRVHQDVSGCAFAVWAPAARAVRVVGDFNSWDGRIHPMRSLGSSGVWELFVPGVGSGARYKFEVVTASGVRTLKADPMAFAAEEPPGTASVVHTSTYEWGDAAWLAARAATDSIDGRLSIYEVHLGSWRRVPEEGNRSLTYRELGPQLAEYARDLGFTHVELLPVAEHPFGGSWGYQVSSYYAPTARFGTPDDFRTFVDTLHQAGVGVIVDWVPAHFPRDAWALARFDGTALYEHADPKQGEHPDWGTLVFNYGRNEVRNFLVANALYWLEELHVDGLRVDAVASMLYLDYSRKAGQWVPNRYGGNENLDAAAFLRETNTVAYRRNPGVLTIAEESTAFPGVSKPVHHGGLGFSHKWNMGWMHDTLTYFSKDPVHRRHHHNQMTFGLVYAWSENFVLPLSHDEVVHLKGSLLAKMPGDRWQQFANLRALYGWMWAHPGKQLLFMGGELAQEGEWQHDGSLDWHVLGDPAHAGVQSLVRELNRVQAAHPAVASRDFTSDGFRWLDADDRSHSVFAFARFAGDGSPPVVCVANLTPVPRHGYRLGVPAAGGWREILDTDAAGFGGSGMTNGETGTDPTPWHGYADSLLLTLPPLAVVWLTPA